MNQTLDKICEIKGNVRNLTDEGFNQLTSRWGYIPHGICINVRLDLFMADQDTKIISSHQSFGLWTLDYLKISDKKDENTDKKRRDHDGKQRVIVLSEEDCVRLYFSLKNEEYQSIVQSFASKDAWKKIDKTLSKERETALEDSNNKLVQHLEWCRRTIQSFRHKEKKTIIKLGVPAPRKLGSRQVKSKIEGIPKDSLDPATLMDRLHHINFRCQSANFRLQRNHDIIRKVIKHVQMETETVRTNAKDLVEVFRTLSRSSEEQAKVKREQSINHFYGIWKKTTDHSKVRKYNSLHVSMIKGNVLELSYFQMVRKGYLLDLEMLDCLENAKGEKVARKWVTKPIAKRGWFYSDEEGWNFTQFKSGINFTFMTSTRPDEISLMITYSSQEETSYAKSCFATTDERNLIMHLEFRLMSGGLRVREIGRTNSDHISYKGKMSQIEYNPLGDKVPIRKSVRFRFKGLYEFMIGESFNRPNKVFDVDELLSKSGLEMLLLDVSG